MQLTDAEITALYDRYGQVLYARCWRILKDEQEAWDAVQETFARVIRNHQSFRAAASPLTWMYAISTNWCLNQLRNRRGRGQKLERRADELVPAHPGELPDEDRQRLLALLAEVDEETQKCVIYTWFDDCTREEVAKLVGISVPTVRKRLNQFIELARSRWGLAAVAVVATLLLLFLAPGGLP